MTTQDRLQGVVAEHGLTSSGFELKANQMLAPVGEGPFRGMSRESRNDLAHGLLALLGELNHATHFVAIDKKKLSECIEAEGAPTIEPYELAFEAMISRIDWHVRSKLGSSARAMILADEKKQYDRSIAETMFRRRFVGPKAHRVRSIVELANPIDSHRNQFVQLADLVSFCVKKHLEVELGYKPDVGADAAAFFADAFELIQARSPRKSIVEPRGSGPSREETFRGAFAQPRGKRRMLE